MRFKITALAVLGLFAQSAHAFEPFAVRDIRIEGAERTEAGTIYTYLPIHSGDRIDEQKVQQALVALFDTGFFSDVRLDIDGNDLVVVVQERPVISSLTFTGINDINVDDLRKSLKGVGLAEARVFDQALLDNAMQELRRQYYARGKYSVQITPRVTAIDKSRVDIAVEVSEGVTAKIRKLTIIGNEAFTESRLRSRLSLDLEPWWNPLSSRSQYSKARLQGDEEALRSYYQNRGFIEFELNPTQVGISPDKKNIFITYSLNEGGAYTVGEVRFAGEYLLPPEELAKLLGLKKGDVFSRQAVTEGINRIVERLGDDGYAFANVNAIPELDKNNHIANFTFVVDAGRRIYVNRINVTGNTQTADEVIRREMRQLEAAPYSTSKIKRSKRRLDALGFFSEVNVDTPAVPGSPDQVDLNVRVTEKETGNMLFGVGYSQGQGVVLNASVSQANFMGTGNRVELRLNGSKVNRVYSLSYTNPYWTPDGISRGFDIYQRYVDPTGVDLGQYSTETVGGRVRFSVPISESNSIFYGVGVENTLMQLYDSSPQKYFDFVDTYGNRNYTVLGTIGWSSDSRDSPFTPTTGSFSSLNVETGLPLGDIKFVKVTYQHQWFYPLSRYFTFMANGELGWAAGYAGQKLPFYQNFYAGGVESVRGYRSGSLGPRDVNNDSVGGDRRVVGNLELFFPLPNMEEDTSVRPSLFVDGGWIYGLDERLDLGELRYSAGAALTWVSPLGPLKFSFGFPLNKKEGDKTQRFQFQLGNVF